MNQRLTFPDRRRSDEDPGWAYIFNSISIYHAGVLGGVFIWGVLATSGVGPPPGVRDALPPILYTIWAVMHMVAPPMVWGGMIIKHRAKTLRDELTGWQLKLTGDLALACVTTTTLFMFAAIGQALLILFCLGMLWCAIGMTVRDIDKTYKAWKVFEARSCRGNG